MTDDITFRVDHGSEAELRQHLIACDAGFVPPLSERTDIAVYAHRLATLATRFEAWQADQLVGLVAAYFGGESDDRAFVTSVSVLPTHHHRGIASELISRTVMHARESKLRAVRLEVGAHNRAARSLYERMGFALTGSGDSVVTMELDLSTEDDNAN